MNKVLANLLACCCLLIAASSAVLAKDAGEKPSVFDLPRLQTTHNMAARAVALLFARKEYIQAETVLRKALEGLSHVANLHYNLACALAQQGKNDEALAALEEAVKRGYRDPNHIGQDSDLEGLRRTERYRQILKMAAEPLEQKGSPWSYAVQPAKVIDGVAMVGETNVAWNSKRGLFQVFFQFDEDPPDDTPIAKGLGKAGDLLRTWYEEGTAAGNYRDLYDNHDSDHSNMDYRSLPQLTRIEFCEEARKRKLHHGTQLSMLYNSITLGNSSTALTAGPTWRSQGRHLMMQPRGAVMAYTQYRASHLYFYPEHRDHDPEHGDLYPANTPYMIISQGSSGSDKPFMSAVGATLAAFRPEVKKELTTTGMLMPAIQMVFRMSNKMVKDADDYLSGKAHPSVFEKSDLDVEKMVTLAHDMKPDNLPPLMSLKVVAETEAVVGRDYFDVGPREKLFDTPCAIARVVKSTTYMRRMVVSAEESKDLRNKPLTYHWTVLRGDRRRIEINPLNDAGSVVELLVPYHEREPVRSGSDLESNRVDIGGFVHNGTYYSAPSFVTFFYLDNQKRVYDRKKRIKSVDYADPKTRDNYVDPLLDFQKDWRDEYRYDRNGELLGWTRVRGEEREEFTSDGLLVIEKDGDKPVKTCAVRYTLDADSNGIRRLVQQVIEAE